MRDGEEEDISMYITSYDHNIEGGAYEPSRFKRGVQEILPRHVLRCYA